MDVEDGFIAARVRAVRMLECGAAIQALLQHHVVRYIHDERRCVLAKDLRDMDAKPWSVVQAK